MGSREMKCHLISGATIRNYYTELRVENLDK